MSAEFLITTLMVDATPGTGVLYTLAAALAPAPACPRPSGARAGSCRTWSRRSLATIMELARSLHLEVVAEGVETTEQHAVPGSLSCSHARGYLFGRPLPAADQQPAPSRIPAPGVSRRG